MVRYMTERHKAHRVLDLTNLTVEEFKLLILVFKVAFVQHMEE